MMKVEEQPSDVKPHEDMMVADLDDDDDDSVLAGDEEAPADHGEKTQRATSVFETSAKEDSRIRMFRFFVVGMLLMTTVVTATAYYFLDREENRNFETAYTQFARTLVDAALEQQQSLRDSMATLSNEITGHAQANNLTWPYVILPLFESYALNYFKHCAGEYVGVNNLVKHNESEAYINWTTAHYKDWIEQSHIIRYGNTDLLDTDPTRYNQFISKKSAEGEVPDDVREYYSARTIQSPPMRGYGPLMNLNIASIGTNDQVIDGVIKLKYETLVTALKPFQALPPEEHQNFHTDSKADNPHSFMYHPVYKRVREPGSGVVATVTASVAWDASMRNLLPSNVRGILCVVENTCDQVFTYEINGKDAIYLGSGDMHNPKYDHLEVMVDLSMHTHPNFTTTPGHCQYSMHVYPTETFEGDYTTAMPITFAVVVLASFITVALVFIIYDWFVKRRNKELSKTAARSDRLVSSLFPGDIKSKVLEQHDDTDRSFSNPKKEQADHGVAHNMLAQVYPETTILFADLVGFTKWSSGRTPAEVFELLETLYKAFDTVAQRRNVFKVETIGDCYVAATGIPDPQAHHASIMVRFATDCMTQMKILTAELSESLGPDTATLLMRVGMHSGPVTGGVLRGCKSRFQLFGDSMNTASRMESNGVPERIHVSQATADLLVSQGKGNWLTPREDKVVAKGKGELQTYFAAIAGRTATTVSSAETSLFGDADMQSRSFMVDESCRYDVRGESDGESR
ncbi:Receptor-type guanylate cyclase gcy [Seminavis robusta]|uniref:Receptor-type guanylate cyclase gcy n=1 Tax=Seminavis robusta TaxID=568900 RepID=A0A9N8HEE1_9STRA|nr:Receptor-type guanylate cyclase gcy [Seminavis robusta]|eukprot:Sro468_g149150.1 Receptor-type guanylate cyclase gcy (743) ;mRNA; f:37044-40100